MIEVLLKFGSDANTSNKNKYLISNIDCILEKFSLYVKPYTPGQKVTVAFVVDGKSYEFKADTCDTYQWVKFRDMDVKIPANTKVYMSLSNCFYFFDNDNNDDNDLIKWNNNNYPYCEITVTYDNDFKAVSMLSQAKNVVVGATTINKAGYIRMTSNKILFTPIQVGSGLTIDGSKWKIDKDGTFTTNKTNFTLDNEFVTKEWVLTNAGGSSNTTSPDFTIYETESTKALKYMHIYPDRIIMHRKSEVYPENTQDYLDGNSIVISADNKMTGIYCVADLEDTAVPKAILTAQSGLAIVNDNNYNYAKLYTTEASGTSYGLDMFYENTTSGLTYKVKVNNIGISLKNSKVPGSNNTTYVSDIVLDVNNGLVLTKGNSQFITLNKDYLKLGGTNEWAGTMLSSDPSKLLLNRVSGTVMLNNSWLRISNATQKASTWLGPTHFQIGGDGGGLSGSNTDFNIDINFGTDKTRI